MNLSTCNICEGFGLDALFWVSDEMSQRICHDPDMIVVSLLPTIILSDLKDTSFNTKAVDI